MEAARAAGRSDLGEIFNLATHISEELQDHRGGDLFFRREGLPGTNHERIADALDSEACVLVVGEFDDCILGYGLAQIERLADGSQIGRLDALVVDVEARGVGIGEAMMNLVLEGLRSAGCVSVDSQALPGDRHTKNFFESFGLKARLLTVNMTL